MHTGDAVPGSDLSAFSDGVSTSWKTSVRILSRDADAGRTFDPVANHQFSLLYNLSAQGIGPGWRKAL
jgi:hypothetical protein